MNVREIRAETKHIMLVDNTEYVRYGEYRWAVADYCDIHYEEYHVTDEFAKELEEQFKIYHGCI